MNASDYATEKYRVSTPCTLLSISPSLAALHAARFQNLQPETAGNLNVTHCSRCGAYAFDGQGSTLLVRRNKKKRSGYSQRVYRRICHTCSHTTDTPVPYLDTTTIIRSDAAPSPLPLKRVPDDAITDASLDKSEPPSKQETPSLRTSPTPTKQSLPVRSRKSQEKTAQTLREMLSRDRQREETKKAQKKNDTRGGLTAFLKGL